jgi:hypothetical protein
MVCLFCGSDDDLAADSNVSNSPQSCEHLYSVTESDGFTCAYCKLQVDRPLVGPCQGSSNERHFFLPSGYALMAIDAFEVMINHLHKKSVAGRIQRSDRDNVTANSQSINKESVMVHRQFVDKLGIDLASGMPHPR